MAFPINQDNGNYNNFNNYSNHSNQFQKQAQMFAPNNFPMNPPMQNQPFDNNSGSFGGQQRGRGGYQNRGNNYRGRGGNRNYNNNNRIPNPDFNSINENNENNDQLDDEYNMSIYDKPNSSDPFRQQNFKTQNLSAYDPYAENDIKGKSVYDK